MSACPAQTAPLRIGYKAKCFNPHACAGIWARRCPCLCLIVGEVVSRFWIYFWSISHSAQGTINCCAGSSKIQFLFLEGNRSSCSFYDHRCCGFKTGNFKAHVLHRLFFYLSETAFGEDIFVIWTDFTVAASLLHLQVRSGAWLDAPSHNREEPQHNIYDLFPAAPPPGVQKPLWLVNPLLRGALSAAWHCTGRLLPQHHCPFHVPAIDTLHLLWVHTV